MNSSQKLTEEELAQKRKLQRQLNMSQNSIHFKGRRSSNQGSAKSLNTSDN